MKKLVFTLMFAVVVVPARAGFDEDCPSLNEVRESIMNCGQNVLASEVASMCAGAVKAAWAAEGARLMGTLKLNDAKLKGEQDKLTVNARNDYLAAINSLDQQITQMQHYTNLVSTYTQVMMDYPEGTSEATSAECFNSAFNDVSKTVADLDNEIIRAMDIRDAAIKMMNTSQAAHKGYDNKMFESKSPMLKTNRPPASAQPVVPKPKAHRESDVSGIKEDEAARKKVE